MIYSEPLINQVSRFLTSIGFGFILCVIYIALKILFRVIGKGKASVMASDGVFVLSGSILSFFFMVIENNGQVRLNLVIGQLLGGLVMYFTVGRYILKLTYPVSDAVGVIIRKLLYPIKVYFKAFINVGKRLLSGLKSKNKQKNKNNKKKIKLLRKLYVLK